MLTAAIDGQESSPVSGWVTSAPKIIAGMSLTKGILQSYGQQIWIFWVSLHENVEAEDIAQKLSLHVRDN